MYHTYIHTVNITFPLLNIENMAINGRKIEYDFKTWKKVLQILSWIRVNYCSLLLNKLRGEMLTTYSPTHSFD